MPVQKKDDKSEIGYYRPISILQAISTIIQRFIFNQMHDYLPTNKIYFEGQYEFSEKHSSELAAVEMIDRITQELDKGNPPIDSFLDLSQDFDIRLITKLWYIN